MGPLGSYLPYLLNRAGVRIATSFGEAVRPLGATLQIWRVLAALRERDEQGENQRKMAEFWNHDR